MVASHVKWDTNRLNFQAFTTLISNRLNFQACILQVKNGGNVYQVRHQQTNSSALNIRKLETGANGGIL